MNVGVVAIGRNEGQRLKVCLESALRDCRNVVYVDSGSTDGSVALARSLGATVVELDLSTPFTAARSRNAGFEKLMQIAPDTSAVQFVDGDCKLVEKWIEKASECMSLTDTVGVVCGRRRERYPGASIYNTLCDIEWDTPVGPAKSCGGDALVRVEAFRQVKGFNPSIIAGEEPEFCVRLRAKRWTILRINEEMTLHDAAMSSFGQWWKRNVRAGHAYAEGFAMHGAPPERHCADDVRRIWTWGAIIPCAMIVTIALARLFGGSFWWIALIVLALYPLQIFRIALRNQKRAVVFSSALLYGAAVLLAKFPELIGMLKYRQAQSSGQKSGLIEYKGSAHGN